MKTFNLSEISTTKRTEILNEARESGAILQKKNTNGDVLEEFYIAKADRYGDCINAEELCTRLKFLEE